MPNTLEVEKYPNESLNGSIQEILKCTSEEDYFIDHIEDADIRDFLKNNKTLLPSFLEYFYLNYNDFNNDVLQLDIEINALKYFNGYEFTEDGCELFLKDFNDKLRNLEKYSKTTLYSVNIREWDTVGVTFKVLIDSNYTVGEMKRIIKEIAKHNYDYDLRPELEVIGLVNFHNQMVNYSLEKYTSQVLDFFYMNKSSKRISAINFNDHICDFPIAEVILQAFINGSADHNIIGELSKILNIEVYFHCEDFDYTTLDSDYELSIFEAFFPNTPENYENSFEMFLAVLYSAVYGIDEYLKLFLKCLTSNGSKNIFKEAAKSFFKNANDSMPLDWIMELNNSHSKKIFNFYDL